MNFKYRTPLKRARTDGMMSPARSVRDELAMSTANSIARKTSKRTERNGVTTQKTTTKERQRSYKVNMADLNRILCPVFKYKWEGYGFNVAMSYPRRLDANTGPTYDAALGITTHDEGGTHPSALNSNVGTWKSIEWPSGQQMWFESVALPFYKKHLNGCVMSVAELIHKYADVQPNTALHGGSNIAALYSAIETFKTGNILTKNRLTDAVNLCYHGGYQKHEFINYGLADVHLELWELVPRRPMSGYQAMYQNLNQSTDDRIRGWDGSSALTLKFKHDNIWEHLLEDKIDRVPEYNTRSPTDNYNAIDEIHDVGVRIGNEDRRLHYKFRISKPVKITIPPGGKYIYEMKIPAFKVTGGEFLEYLVHMNDAFDRRDNADAQAARIAMRPSWLPKFTRILAGRCWGPKTMSTQTSATAINPYTGNAADTEYINKVGYGPGILGHTMSEYHVMNCMPYMKSAVYTRINNIDADNDIGITVDPAEREYVNLNTINPNTGNDAMDTAQANIPNNNQ